MEPNTPPPPLPSITQIRKHYQKLKSSLEHHHAKIAAAQEELIGSQSQQIHTYEQRLQAQNQNIEGLQKEVERLRGVLTNIHVVDTVSPLNTKKSAGVSYTGYIASAGCDISPDQRTEPFSRPGSRDGPRPLQINKELPPRPVSAAPSINTSLINDLDSLITEFQSSRTTQTPTQLRISPPQPPTPVFYNPYSPQSTFPPPIKPVTDPLPAQPSPAPPFPTRSRAVSGPPAPCHIAGSNGGPNSPSSPHKNRPAPPPLHEDFILPNVSSHLVAAYEGHLPPRLLTPDEFFRRSGLPLPSLPKARVSSRLRKNPRSRAGSKGVVVIEESDEIVRARIREEAGKRRKAVFGDVEKVAKDNTIHSAMTAGGSDASSLTETVRSRRFGKEKDALVSLTVFPLIGRGVKKECEENGDVAQKTSITHSSSTLTSPVGTPRVEGIKSKFKEGDEIGTGPDFERITGLMGYEPGEAAVVVGGPPLEALMQVLSEGGKQTEPGLGDTVKKKLTDMGRYLALGS